MRFASFQDMSKKQAREKAKPETHTPHPETQNPRAKVPGSESSQGQGTARDLRGPHDQDGNREQVRR